MEIWNIVRALGEKEAERVERRAELAEKNVGKGTIAAPILYEENDGVWLKLQGEDRICTNLGKMRDFSLDIALIYNYLLTIFLAGTI